MFVLRSVLLWLSLSVSLQSALAAVTDFSGTWSIDLRNPAERKKKVECGSATFKLSQSGDKIIGDHSFATSNCGRLNDGGPGTVKGIVVGSTAVLVVTSERNGAIILGKATIRNNLMYWQTVEEIKEGEPKGDSALILSKGALSRAKE